MLFSQSGLKSIAVSYLSEGGLSSPNEINQDPILDSETTKRYEIEHRWSKTRTAQLNWTEQMVKHTKCWSGPLLPSPKRLRRERIISGWRKKDRIERIAEYFRRSIRCTCRLKYDCHLTGVASNRVSVTIRPILDYLQRQ